MYASRRPTSTSSLSLPGPSAPPDPSYASQSSGQGTSSYSTGYSSDESDTPYLLPPPRPVRITPALSYFQAYAPLAATMPSSGSVAQANTSSYDAQPAGPGRRMSKVRMGGVDDLLPAQAAAATAADVSAPKLTSRSSSSKDAGRPSGSSASRPSAVRSSSSSRDVAGQRSDRSAPVESSSGRPSSSQQRSTKSNGGRPDPGPSPVRKSRSDTLGSVDSHLTGTSSPRSNVTFADPSAAAAAKLRVIANGNSNSSNSSRPVGPSRSASATSPSRTTSTLDTRRPQKSSSNSASAAQRAAPRSDYAPLRGEGQGPPEITEVAASTNAVERRIFLEAHEREKNRLQQQQDFVRERQRTLLKELEVTKALPGLLKGEKPPKSKEEVEREERHRREKAAGSRSGSGGHREAPSGRSRSQKPPSRSAQPPPASFDGRSRPSPSRSNSTASASASGPRQQHRLSTTSDVSTRSRDKVPPPLSKREQLNIRTIDEIIRTGLDQEVLLHAPNPRPQRSAFAPSPTTARFPAAGSGAMERTESESSVGELDSGTEEASRMVYMRDGKPLSWGWHGDHKQDGQHDAHSPSQHNGSRPSLDSQADFGPFAPASAPEHKSSISSILTASSTSTVQQADVSLSRRSSSASAAYKGQKFQPARDASLDHTTAIDLPKLTRLVTLARAPYKHHIISLSDVGAPDGHPVVVFLGLGGVRYLTALYDDLAQSMGLRLICIDRFGLGKSDDVPEDKRGFLPWAGVVEEVADQLGLDCFSILAHSAGSPFAMAACLRLGQRVFGSVNLLAPWVGLEVDGGYKWLRYVPAGVIKTAQAAEWKMQGWMLGKPVSPSPTISKAGPPPVKVAARDSVSHSTASSSSPTSSGSLPDTDGVPEEALAYMGIHGRSSPSPLDGETTEYPIPGRTSSPACEATNGKPPRADFGTALLRACHAENRGGTADLLAIMRKSSEWGFAYTDVDLPVKVWYGDRDEKINEKSVRWLERELVDCTLIVKKGEGHNLLSSIRVIIEVLESIAAEVGRG